MEASTIHSWTHVGERYEALYASALGNSVRSILDVPINVTTFSEAAERLDSRFHHGHPAMVVFANAHTLNSMRAHDRVRAALRGSIVLNDGIGIDIASRILFGRRFPENLNGTDFVPRYLQSTANRYRIFLLGAKPGVARRAAAQLSRLAPQHRIVGYCHGYLAGPYSDRIADGIRQTRADLLLVAMGDPQQELWLTEHLDRTGCRLGFCVGALFDFMAGSVQRAPQWARDAHLEWLYRMMQEPRRLWSRYLVGMPIFLLRVAGQWLAGARVSRVMQE
jgi:alpha-1,3-mannosyltransferase